MKRLRSDGTCCLVLKIISLHTIEGSWPNGLKFTAEFLPGFAHQREALRSPCLDPRLHPRRALGIDDEGSQGRPGAWRAEPPQRIAEADPLRAEALKCGGVPHDHADHVVNHGQDGQLLQHARYGLTMPHIHRHDGLKMGASGFDVPGSAVQRSELGHARGLRVEERGHERDLAGAEAWAVDVVAHLSER
jgi:hypothetical protein